MEKGIAIILLITSLFYLTWHLGRAHEANLANQTIENALNQMVYTDYFIPDWDEKYPGEIAAGNCMPNKTADDLCEYIGLDH